MHERWMMLDDSDLVYNRWILTHGRLLVFRLFWYFKKRICDAFCDGFATRPPFPCKKTPDTPDTDDTFDSDTDTPFPTDTSVSSFSVSGNS